MVFLNEGFYWVSFHNGAIDNTHREGFPFTFSETGGYAYTYAYSQWFMLADLFIGCILSLSAGWITVWATRNHRPAGRGFGVIALDQNPKIASDEPLF